MFIPLRDDSPHRVTPYVNYGIILACVAVFFWQAGLSNRAGELAVWRFGMIPGTIFGNVLIDPRVHRLPAVATIFTSMFLHGGLFHLLGNMLYLWIFGANIEASVGHKRYLIFYLLCGFAAAVAQMFSMPSSEVPMIGASGAISGVLGAYFVLSPRANIKVLLVLIIFFTVINLPAFIVLGFWFIVQLLSQAGADPNEPGVAFMAHIGGFIAGAILVWFFRQRNVRVWAPAVSCAFATQRVRRGSVPDFNPRSRKGPWS